jgi:hypothetical protein
MLQEFTETIITQVAIMITAVDPSSRNSFPFLPVDYFDYMTMIKPTPPPLGSSSHIHHVCWAYTGLV